MTLELDLNKTQQDQDDDISNLYTRRIFIDELFPGNQLVQQEPSRAIV